MTATHPRATAKPLKPGWRMTEDQAALFWQLWRAACAYQGWDALPAAERDEKRHQVLAECGFGSLRDVDTTQGFDDVKKALLALQGRVHNEPEDAGQRRRLLSRIGTALADLGEAGYPQKSLDTIMRCRFKIIPGAATITDLETPELLNFLRTLTARLASWKKRPGQATADTVQPLCNVNAADMPQACKATAELLFEGC